MPEPRTHRLPSGLTLLLEPDPAAQTVAAGYFVQTGARDEPARHMGVSHFLEHLLFKGSETLPAAELNARLDDLGGHANAFTSEETTVYHAASLPERTGELLDTLTELMHPALRDHDIGVERGVILEEIAMYADQPGVRVIDELRADYWGDAPLGHRVLGTPETVAALTPDILRGYHQERYGAARVALTVTGAFDPAAVHTWAEAHLSGWPAGPTPQLTPTPTPGHPGHVRVVTDHALTRVQVAACTPGLALTHPLREAAAVLGDLIGGENGALYWAMLDTGLCDSADLAHLDYRDAGAFEGGFSCDPDRTAQALATFRAVLAQAGDLITDTGVRRAARKLAVSTLLRAETPQGRLFTLGMEYLAHGQALTTEDLVRRYEQVSAEQVREVLRLCPLDQLTVVALGPLDALN